MIDISKLAQDDVNRLVVYTPLKGAKVEQGRITSWNGKFIFVDYTNVGRGVATRSEDLHFL